MRQKKTKMKGDKTMFQSTHSLRSATWVTPPSGRSGLFQSTHSLRSATYKTQQAKDLYLSFNPRTPCGVRPCESSHCNHATGFNPRTPCGVRPAPLVRMTQTPQFQSTHSLRSATARRAFNISDDAVSIHALLAECDFVFFWNCKCST